MRCTLDKTESNHTPIYTIGFNPYSSIQIKKEITPPPTLYKFSAYVNILVILSLASMASNKN